MRKTTPPLATLKMIRSLNIETGVPTTGIDALIEKIETEDDELFALCLAALSELEKQSKKVAITRH